MTDNIKPKEIDMYELWYQTYPFEQYKAIMQAISEQNMRLDDNNRVENLEEAIYTLERLKEKEIEHAKKNTKTLKEAFAEILDSGVKQPYIAGQYLDEIYYRHDDLLKRLRNEGYQYLARDGDGGELYAYHSYIYKVEEICGWDNNDIRDAVHIRNDNFPGIQWTDDEPTRIEDLLETYSKSEITNTVKPKIAGQYLENVYPYHDDLLKQLYSDGYDYLARDESGELWTHSFYPTKQGNKWRSISYVKRIYNDNFPEVKWKDDKPTEISELLATYQNGGESGK